MTSVRANGITIHYDSFGAIDAEAMVLIAGLGTQMIRWPVPLCQDLAARGYQVIRFDNRDAGLSTHFPECPAPDFAALAATLARGQRPDVPYTLHDMAADTIGLLDALSIARASGRPVDGRHDRAAGRQRPRGARDVADGDHVEHGQPGLAIRGFRGDGNADPARPQPARGRGRLSRP